MELRRAKKDPKHPFPYLIQLVVYARDRDGSLLARLEVSERGGDRSYTRRLRVPATLGSTSTRGIHLRGGSRSSY